MDQQMNDMSRKDAWKRDLVIQCGAAAYLVYKYMRRKMKMRQFQRQGWFYHSERHIGDMIGLTRHQTRVALDNLRRRGYLQKLERCGPNNASCWVVVEPEVVRSALKSEPTLQSATAEPEHGFLSAES